MKQLFAVLVALCLLGTAPHASAACRRYGTQLECELRGRQFVIGTQAAPQPGYAGAFRPHLLSRDGGAFDDRPAADAPLRLELENVGTDTGLCWKFGNETYCH